MYAVKSLISSNLQYLVFPSFQESFSHFRLSTNAKEHKFLVSLCVKSEENGMTLIDWLKGVTWSISNEKSNEKQNDISQATVSVLVSAFLIGGNNEIRSTSQEALVALAKHQPETVSLSDSGLWSPFWSPFWNLDPSYNSTGCSSVAVAVISSSSSEY